jgi:TPR repeat protein
MQNRAMFQLIENIRINRYLKKGRYSQAIRLLSRRARNGHPDAAFQMGLIYSNAWNVIGTDYDFLAEKWFSKAAESGHVQAQLMLGDLYSIDAHRPARLHRALNWYRVARSNGEVVAGRKLASLYLKYRHNTDEVINSTGLLIDAAEKGDYKAIVLLAWGYKKGCMGLPNDIQRFQYWWSRLQRLPKVSRSKTRMVPAH